MSLKEVIGQKVAQEILSRALKKNRLANTYLFYGPPGVGKFLLAWRLAQTLLCEKPSENLSACETCPSCLKVARLRHPDLYLVFPHPGGDKPKEVQEHEDHFRQAKMAEPYQLVEYNRPINIPADKIRFLKEQIYRMPFQSERKIVIIEQAESMRSDSTNLLLKIFEEPPGDTVLVLTTSQIDRMLPTVVSRSQKIRFAPIRPEIIKSELQRRFSLDERKAEYYASLSEGSLGVALNFASGRWEKTLENSYRLWQAIWPKQTKEIQELIETFNLEKDRSQILMLLKIWQYLLRDIFLTSAGLDSGYLMLRQLPPQALLLGQNFAPQQIYLAFQTINRARLDFYRNLGIKSLLVGLVLSLQSILWSHAEEN
jgi:DNA polymerase III subunit delta'